MLFKLSFFIVTHYKVINSFSCFSLGCSVYFICLVLSNSTIWLMWPGIFSFRCVSLCITQNMKKTCIQELKSSKNNLGFYAEHFKMKLVFCFPLLLVPGSEQIQWLLILFGASTSIHAKVPQVYTFNAIVPVWTMYFKEIIQCFDCLSTEWLVCWQAFT